MGGRWLVVGCVLLSGCNLLLGDGGDDVSLIIEPPNLDFGAVVVANESAPVELALIAIADTAPLDISLEGSADFQLRSNPCGDVSLAAGEICRVELVFSPETPEARAGALVVAGELAVLGGFGIEDRGFDFTPPVAAFGPLPLGDSSDRELTLENNSGSPAVLELELAPTDPLFSIKTDTCSNVPLAPELSCSVTLSFQPQSEGSFAGSLRATDTAESELVSSVSLSGEGVIEVRTLSVQITNEGRVVSSPAGIDCSSNAADGCSASFALGETVSLEATAGLESWQGDCAGSANNKPCLLVMDTDRVATAIFTDCSDGGPSCAPDGGLPQLDGSVR